MRVFAFHIDDRRYAVPTLLFVVYPDESLARAHAWGVLRESEHHRGVEVFEDGERVFGLVDGTGD